MESSHHESVRTGLPALDDILDRLRIGDNVVWRVDQIDDYRRFVSPFVQSALAEKREIIYLRFGNHPPLVEPGPGVTTVTIDALGGFETFTGHVWRLIEDHGRGAFYVFDCLSDLLDAWVTDIMVGNFFRVICPLLYELDTVAYFALYTRAHSQQTLNRIRETTQVLLDVHRTPEKEVYLQPLKVWQRFSPTMFLLHHQEGEGFRPITDSSEATRLQVQLEVRLAENREHRLLDHWDRLFLRVGEVLAEGDHATSDQALLRQVVEILIGRDPRMLDIATRHLSLQDVLDIRARLIGTGFIGGKAAGMLVARAILLGQEAEYWTPRLEPHDSWYLGSDVFYAFLVHNGWWPMLMRQRTEKGYFREAELLRRVIPNGELPPEVRVELERMLDYYGQYPILVRSSSLLEDGFGNAFAGKYESVFLINQGDPEMRLRALEDAIRFIYASTLSEDALSYRLQRGLAGREEPMALLFQRVNGRYHDQFFMPDAAGVGVSRNAFVWDGDMDPSAGMVRLVMGLGTRAVDRIEGDHAAVIALDQPRRQPYRNQTEGYRFSQHQVDVLDVSGAGLVSQPLQDLVAHMPAGTMAYLAEDDREASRRARELGLAYPIWRLTFTRLLDETPFVDAIQRMLGALEGAYEHPVDIEFTLHLDEGGQPLFNLVQCRPLATIGGEGAVELPEQVHEGDLWFETRGHFMGGNVDLSLAHVVRVSPQAYALLARPQRYELASLVGAINRCLAEDSAGPVMLMGPGRWGTSSPELGVPVRFSDISNVSVLVEEADMGSGMVPDLSYGSHFFQDLVESGIVYVALFPDEAGTHYCRGWLSNVPETELDRLGIGNDWSPEVREALSLHAVEAEGLRLMADLVSQRLICFQRR